MFISSVFLLVTLCISARDIYFFSWLCLFLHASLDVIWSAISSRYCVISCFCDVTWPRYFWTRLPYFWTRLPYFWARRAPCCNYAADAWQCDNPSPSVSYAAMCLGLPSSCLLTKEKPDCLTLVHTVRPSDAHRAYLHESDICRTLTISGKRTIIVRLYVWFIPVGKWRPLSRLAMGIKVLWVTSPVQNSQPRSWSQFKSSFPSVLTGSKKGNLRVQSVLLAPLSTISDETPSHQRTSRF